MAPSIASASSRSSAHLPRWEPGLEGIELACGHRRCQRDREPADRVGAIEDRSIAATDRDQRVEGPAPITPASSAETSVARMSTMATDAGRVARVRVAIGDQDLLHRHLRAGRRDRPRRSRRRRSCRCGESGGAQRTQTDAPNTRMRRDIATGSPCATRRERARRNRRRCRSHVDPSAPPGKRRPARHRCRMRHPYPRGRPRRNWLVRRTPPSS